MKRNLLLTVILACAFALGSSFAAFAQDGPELFRATLANRTNQAVSVLLEAQDGSSVYRLSAPAGESRVFTIAAGSYKHTTFACGGTATGELQVNRQLRLVFTPCPSLAPNSGAPSLEKVHLTDAPDGIKWFYQYDPAPRQAGLPQPDGMAPGACQFTATEEVLIYNRPSTGAGVFSTQPAGFTIGISARTEDGWLGFDPGVAQAANVGPFRLRWIEPEIGKLSGGCSSLPVVWGPPQGICFFMPMTDTNVRANPDSGAAVLTVLNYGEFAEVAGIAPGGDWAQVDLTQGNTGLTTVGWVESSALNVSGPCDSLPIVTP